MTAKLVVGLIIIALAVVVGGRIVFAQSPTMLPSPTTVVSPSPTMTPTQTIPRGAPSTGLGGSY